MSDAGVAPALVGAVRARLGERGHGPGAAAGLDDEVRDAVLAAARAAGTLLGPADLARQTSTSNGASR